MTTKTTTYTVTEYQEKLDDVNERIASTLELIQKYPEQWTLNHTLDGYNKQKEYFEATIDMLQKPPEQTTVEQEVRSLLDARNQIGRETYGKGLDHSDLQHNWYDMALEESMDLIKYIMAQKLRAQHGIELTDVNIKYVADKMYKDQHDRNLFDECIFINNKWHNIAKKHIEMYNYLSGLLWRQPTQD